MSTRGLIKIYESALSTREVRDRKVSPAVVICNRSDPYLEGLGLFLKGFINSETLINGFTPSVKKSKDKTPFNGLGVFACRLIARMLSDDQNIYIQPNSESNGDSCKTYEYHIFVDEVKNMIKVICYDPEGNEVKIPS